MSTSPSPRSEKGQDKFWLYAFRDHLANLKVYNNGLCTADVQGNGNYELIVADASKRLKVYGGTSLQRELRLSGMPSAVTVIHVKSFSAQPPRPVIAVGVGAVVLMYSNFKPLYRFHLPEAQLDADEVSAWAELGRDDGTVNELVARLLQLSEQGRQVCSRTLQLLLLDSDERAEFVRRVRDKPLRELDGVTCMASLNVDQIDADAASTLIVGTERGWVHVLKPGVVELALSLRLPSTPTDLLPTGCLHVDYHLTVACRDSRLYFVKNGALRSTLLQPDAQPVAVAQYDHLVAVATMANTLSYYTIKAKRQFRECLTTSVTNMATLTDPTTLAARGLVVALSSGEIRVYVGTQLRHVSQVFGTVTSMLYGRYGREDAALMLVLQNGTLVVELLHRKALITASTPSPPGTAAMGPPPEQNVPLPLPKLSSVFTVQSERERGHGVDMYRTYRFDLTHMRLYTAKAYLHLMQGGAAASSVVADLQPSSPGNGLRLVASVSGMGPTFKLVVAAHNGGTEVLHEVWLLVSHDSRLCEVTNGVQGIGYLAPGADHTCSTLVRVKEDCSERCTLTVYATQDHRQRPLYVTEAVLPAVEPLE